MKRKLIKGVLYLLGFIVLGFIVINTDWKQVMLHIKSISPKMIILLFLSQCITIVLLAIQWKLVTLKIKKEAPFWDILMVNAKGSIVDAITPGVKAGGELARVYEFRKRLKIDFGNATIIVGLQKFISLISFLFLTLCSLIWFSFTMTSQYKYYLYIFSIVIAIFSIFLASVILFSLKPAGVIKLLSKILRSPKLMHKVRQTLKDYNHIVRDLLKDKGRFSSQLLLASFIWLFYAFKLLLVMKGFAIEMDYISIAAITFLAYIIGMIPMLPGSIGSFESAMLLLLAMKGVPMEVGVSIAFVFRFVTFWFEFIVSCMIFMFDYILVFFKKGDKDVRVRT